MSKPRKSPEDVCIEYAIAAEAVREQTRIIRANRCTTADRPSERSYTEGSMTPCLDDEGLDRDDWCEACKVREIAIAARKSARQRLKNAKRSVEVVGKRLNAAPKSLGETPTVSPKK